METKEVSLYIPCFNAAKTLSFCLKAAFKQDYPLKEIIVVDDGSSDETIKIASQYPVRIIKHEVNRGLATARNTAIKNINTEFIASLDADCLPNPDWLRQLMNKFRSSKIVGAGGKLLEKDSSSVFSLWRSIHMRQYWKDKQVKPPFLYGSNTVFRREALIKIKLYNQDYKNNYEDVDISKRFKKRGYSLIYASKAVVYHLRTDDIRSILNTYWNWHLPFYQEKKYHSSAKKLIFKIKDNLGLANRYLEEDLISKRHKLLYLDFLLALHHSFRDLDSFISQNNKNLDNPNRSLLYFWLALSDLAFFYHFDYKKKSLSTLMPKTNALLQNFFALDLILGKIIREKFKNKKFQKILYKHLFLSVYKLDDGYLLDKLLNLVNLNQDWSGLLKKKQPNLDNSFLKTLSLNLEKWVGNLIYCYPKIIRMIENSAEKTEELSFSKKED